MAADDHFPNVRHLYALQDVAQLHRINLAAERVHLSQPAVTQAIGKIEAVLDARLFDRRAEGMFATDVGEIFLRRVARTLDLLQEGARQVRRKSGGAGKLAFHRQTTAVQLRALTAVARTGNFSHAARELGVSQPAVHRAARDLERLAGVDFFAPARRGVELTQAAEAFAHHVRLARAEIRQGFFEVSAFQGQDSTQIVVGSMPLSRATVLPEAVTRLLGEGRSRVQVHCVDGAYGTLLRNLRFGELDFLIGALRDPVQADDVVQEPLFDDSLVVVSGRGHPLADRDGVALDDTLEFPWIAPPKETPSGRYLFDTLGIPHLPDTPVRVVASSLVLVRELVQRGDYLTIMSRRQIDVEAANGVLVPLAVDLPDSARPIGLTFRKGWEATPTQARFLDLIRAAAG